MVPGGGWIGLCSAKWRDRADAGGAAAGHTWWGWVRALWSRGREGSGAQSKAVCWRHGGNEGRRLARVWVR